jgi:hypothetical protein
MHVPSVSANGLPLQAAAPAILQVLDMKYGPVEDRGWGPSLRSKFHYCTPDDW